MHPLAPKANWKKKMAKSSNISSFVSRESQMEHMGMAGLYTGIFTCNAWMFSLSGAC